MLSFQATRKNSSGSFKISSTPRTKDPTSNPYFTNFSHVEFGRSLKSDIYAVIHDRHLKHVDPSSPNSIKFVATANKRVDVTLGLKTSEYTVDPKNTKQPCRKDNRKVYDCLIEKMICNPLIESCPNITSPMPAINMEKEYCSVTACKNEFLTTNSIVHNEIHDFLETSEFKNFGQPGVNFALSNPVLQKADTIIQSILEFCNIHMKNEEVNAVFVNFLNNWKKSKWTPEFQPEIINICADLNSIHEPYEYFEIQYGFNSLQETVITEVTTDSSLQLAMDVMGGLGFWLGFSICTIIEFVLYFCTLMMAKIIPDKKTKINSIS